LSSLTTGAAWGGKLGGEVIVGGQHCKDCGYYLAEDGFAYRMVEAREVIEWLDDALAWTEIFPLSHIDDDGRTTHCFDLGALLIDFEQWLNEAAAPAEEETDEAE